MNSPIAWFGGKYYMTKHIIPLFPRHHTYVETFGGGASVLFAKPPSRVEIYNDLDEGLVNLFRVLRDPAQFEAFHRLVSLTPYSRKEYHDCLDTWDETDDPVQRAYCWYVVARQSFSGEWGSSWSMVTTESSRHMAGTCAKWLSAIDRLPAISERLLRVQVECYDWRKILDIYDTPETLFYLDPPYISDTRRSGSYKHEMTDGDHTELVERILQLDGMVVLSGYDHPIYDPLDEWERHEFDVTCSAVGRTRATGLQGEGSASKQRRTEIVWVKPHNRRLQPGLL